MPLGFVKQPLTRYVARGLRTATKGQELDGHRYSFADLKELWISADEHHVVVTHADDDAWQYWTNTPDGGGWILASIHHSRDAACSAAMDHEFLAAQPEPGCYVVARARDGGKEIRVRCESREGPETLFGIYTRMGYDVSIEEVGEKVPIARAG